MVLKRTINVFIKTTLENTFVEHSVRMAEMYGVYTHLIYEQNPGIYGPRKCVPSFYPHVTVY